MSYAVRTRSPVTSRAAVVYAHKNETIDVITSKNASTWTGGRVGPRAGLGMVTTKNYYPSSSHVVE